MGTKINQIVDQFNSIYAGHPWFGNSICDILAGVTPAKAYWQPNEEAHSIAQIVSHMIYWRQAIIKKLEGDVEYKASMKSEDNWKSNEQLKKLSWKKLLESLEESQKKLTSLLSRQSDSIIKKKYSEKATYGEVINGVLQHDLYHTGQIAYLSSIYKK